MNDKPLAKLAQISARPRIQKFFVGPGRTKQEFKEESEITNILARVAKNNLLQNLEERQRTYVDLPSGLDFETAQLKISQGRQAFAMIPAHMRAQFDNNPQEFLEFIENPENADEMVEMGLLRPPTPDEAPKPDLDPGASPEDASGSPTTVPDEVQD